MSKDSPNPKHQALREVGALYTAAEAVRDELFVSHEFFDPYDLVQVKYEMLRRVRIDGVTVRQVAHDFGFSRTAFYQALALWEEQGLPGLIPHRPGPRQAHKLNEAVLKFIEQQQQGADKTLRPEILAARIFGEFNFSVHPRSIERALARRRKKRAIDGEHEDTWCRGVSIEAWAARYEAVRQQALQAQHPLDGGWEFGLLIRRGLVAWMHAWLAIEEPPPCLPANLPTNDSPAPLLIPTSLFDEMTSVLVSMILPRRSVGLGSLP